MRRTLFFRLAPTWKTIGAVQSTTCALEALQPSRAALRTTSRTPFLKDQSPSIVVNTRDCRRRLAVLIDASNTSFLHPSAPSTPLPTQPALEGEPKVQWTYPPLLPSIREGIEKVGVPVLFRLFAHRRALPSVWEPYCLPWKQCQGVAEPSTSAAPEKATSMIIMQHFEVEPFIPIPMQMEADAEHLFRYRSFNKVEGVCYLVKGAESGVWKEQTEAVAKIWEKPDGTSDAGEKAEMNSDRFFNQYVFDEMGLVSAVCNDGRSSNGA